ncbi:MAG: FAD-dependent oxidoreductase [Vicinamibacteria bacterium]
MSRREAVSLISLAALSPQCSRTAAGRRITGSLVGPSMARGHAMRDGRLPPFPATLKEERVDCVIVGGGIAGLSAAWALDRAGVSDFIVLELEAESGGTSTSQTSPMKAPWGAHYVPVPDEANEPLLAILEEAGAVKARANGRTEFAEDVLCRDPQERIFVHDRWYEGVYPLAGSTEEDRSQFDRFHGEMRTMATRRDTRGRVSFAIPRRRSSTDPELQALDQLSMKAWMERAGYTSPRLFWWVEYGCRDDFGADLNHTSAWAGLHYFVSRFRPQDDSSAEFLTWPEGNGRLVDVMARRAAGRVRNRSMVTEIHPGKQDVLVKGFDAHDQPFAIRARTAICALPRPFVARVVRAEEATLKHAAEFTYGSWMVANLLLSKRPADRGFPLAWDNVIYGSPSLGYVVSTHQTGVDQGATTFTYYRAFVGDTDPRETRSEMLRRTWDQWADEILHDLRRAHPDIEDCVERIDVMRWGHAMVRPRPGFMWSDALAEASKPIGRLHFAHTDLSGLALFEEAQDWGIRAAEAGMRDLGHVFRPWWKPSERA